MARRPTASRRTADPMLSTIDALLQQNEDMRRDVGADPEKEDHRRAVINARIEEFLPGVSEYEKNKTGAYEPDPKYYGRGGRPPVGVSDDIRDALHSQLAYGVITQDEFDDRSNAFKNIKGTGTWKKNLTPEQRSYWFPDGSHGVTEDEGPSKFDTASSELRGARSGGLHTDNPSPHPVGSDEYWEQIDDHHLHNMQNAAKYIQSEVVAHFVTKPHLSPTQEDIDQHINEKYYPGLVSRIDSQERNRRNKGFLGGGSWRQDILGRINAVDRPKQSPQRAHERLHSQTTGRRTGSRRDTQFAALDRAIGNFDGDDGVFSFGLGARRRVSQSPNLRNTFRGRFVHPNTDHMIHAEHVGQLPQDDADLLRQHLRSGSVDYIVHSYDTPIAWRRRVPIEGSERTRGEWVVPNRRYSRTTSRHQGVLRNFLSERNIGYTGTEGLGAY